MVRLARSIGALAVAAWAGTAAAEETVSMEHTAKGAFEVKLTPAAVDEGAVASARLTLAKTFTGDLTGTSRGEMWTADGAVKGSAGYVAIERFEGTLHGRRGSFALLHQGTMFRNGNYDLRIVVVPESGTDELAGLAGSFTIDLSGGQHAYEFRYTLPVARP